MKVSVILLAVGVCSWALSDDEVLQKWNEFKDTYGKAYKSPVEAQKRLMIFRKNLQEIEEHNTKFQRGETTYTLGINQFADWTPEEFMHFVNVGLNKPQENLGKIFNKSENYIAAERVDWREKGAVTAIKDQGSCGSCWAFSATGSIEGQLKLTKGQLISLSEQNLVDCSGSEGNYGCGGGLMTAAFEYVMRNGIERESDYPYQGDDARCKADPSKVVTKLSSYVNIPSGDISALEEAITKVGPISVAIDATMRLQMYSSGVLEDRTCSEFSLNHGVLAVGYGSENGVGYYIVKNSWGSSWGESGYFRLIRDGRNRCGIATTASYPTI